jgi:hypothetical protein
MKLSREQSGFVSSQVRQLIESRSFVLIYEEDDLFQFVSVTKSKGDIIRILKDFTSRLEKKYSTPN